MGLAEIFFNLPQIRDADFSYRKTLTMSYLGEE